LSKRLLPLIPAGLLEQQILPSPDHLIIVATPQACSANCPGCGQSSARVHSRYERTLGDLPWQGRPVSLRVRARRFRFPNPDCPRLTFAERPAGTAPVAARRTGRLGDLQQHLALALGGEAGARLARRLAIPTSPDTLLRMAQRGAPLQEPSPAVRVLGVDDFAWRRGHRYGTVLVDLERNRVLDLLPERGTETLAAWLRAHPCIEVIARDRANAYADGAGQGAPDAVQVVARWHMLRNLGDAVHVVAERHHAAVQRVGREVMADLPVGMGPATPAARPPNAAARRAEAARARRQARFEAAARLHGAGASISAISRETGADRKTLRLWLHAGTLPSWQQPRRGSLLEPYRDHLEQRWAEGCRIAARLWRELAKQGFTGRPAIVRAWATRRRMDSGAVSAPVMANGQPWRPPSGRRIARMLMADVATLPKPERAFDARLLEEAPKLAAAIGAAKRLALVLRRRSQENFGAVLVAAAATQLRSFVAELRKDLPAVQAALEMPWTTSPVEGQISRLKMIKRTMYGRAGFDVLRARVLRAGWPGSTRPKPGFSVGSAA
jgi:transposase